IEIKFKGEANVEWTETESTKRDDGTTEEHTVYFKGHEKYFENNYYLVGGSHDDLILPEGEHSYPFSTILPPTLPSSFEGTHGHIRYTAKVKVDRPWKFDHEAKSAFSVICPVDLNTNEKALVPVKQEIEKKFCCWCCESGPLTLVLALPVIGYVAGQDIPVTIEIDNASNISVVDVVCKLKKLITFIANEPYGSKKEEEITVGEIVFDGVTANGSNTATISMPVPPVPPSDLDNCSIIDLTYYLKVTAEVQGCHANLKASTPIIIGTIPIMSYQPAFQTWGTTTIGDIPSSTGPGWRVPSGDNNLPPSYAEITESAEGTLPAPVAPPSEPMHGPSAPPYPDIPSPTFQESIFGTNDIKDSEDNQYTLGSMNFVPRYPVYNFVRK
ncbi:hypothetical protein L9F63_008223, partial [Diploptera punctata]